jgi:hypothetical protein
MRHREDSMRLRHLTLLLLILAAWLVPAPAHAEVKLATLQVQGMV